MLFSLFILLLIVSGASLLIGLINPNIFKRWFKNPSRKAVSLVLGTTMLVAFIGGLVTVSSVEPTSITSKPADTVSQAPPELEQQQLATTSNKVIRYAVVDIWDIPNGGQGKVVVVSPDYLNETDMIALGEKLKSDAKNDRNSFVFIFDDRKAALLRKKVLSDELTEADRDFYDKHYIGEYSKNGNSGFHEFVIYFDGVLGSHQKTIKY